MRSIVNKIFRPVIAAAAGLSLCATVQAQVVGSQSTAKGDIRTGASMSLQDLDPDTTSADTYVSNTNVVRLVYTGSENTASGAYYGTWKYRVGYKLTNMADTTEFILDTLEIRFGPNMAECNFEDYRYYQTNWKSFRVRVTYLCGISGGGTTCLTNPQTYPLLPSDIELQIVMERTKIRTMENLNSELTGLERGTSSDLGIFPQNHLPIACQALDEYITWNTLTWAREYEVEWVYIPDGLYVPAQNDYFNNYVSSVSDYHMAFDLAEPVRVSTNQHYYTLPKEYPSSGRIYIRVRPVGRIVNTALEDYDQPAFYPWAYTVSLLQEMTDFQEDLNWQRVSTFAEDGKFKKVISYYDGLNRTRQSVTHLSSDNSVIIAETLYDHEGRPVVQIMPYPEECIDLSYKPDRHRDISGNGWNKYDFELEANSSNDGEKIGTDAGASQYYSVTNPFLPASDIYSSDYHTPDAGLYPYTRVEYLMDGTGRTSRSSGVGPVHRLYGGHDTRYFYGNTNMVELVRLFGENVGIAGHYKKNLVMDANGQVSANYMDQEGRVVATALTGESPEDLIPLEGAVEENYTVDLIAGNNQLDETNNSSIMVYNVLNVTPGTDYNFTYRLPYEFFFSTAGQECLACQYRLEIRIEGPGIDAGSGTVYETVHTDNVSASSFPVDCLSDPNSYYEWVSPTFIFEQTGTYTVYKKLVWDRQAALDALTAELIDHSGTVLDNFIDQFKDSVDINDCDFLMQNAGHTYPFPEQFGAIADNECKSLFNQMKAQLMPGGYYLTDLDPVTPGFQLNSMSFDVDGYEITSGYDILPDKIRDRYVNNNTETELGVTYTMKLLLADGTDLLDPMPANDDILVQMLLDNWRPEWADILVRFVHPEICHYEACMEYSMPTTTPTDATSSQAYDYLMTQVTDINSQYSGGGNKYLNPQGNSTIDPYHQNPFNALQQFTTPLVILQDPWPAGSNTDLQLKLDDYRTISGLDYSIWEFSHPVTTINPSGTASTGNGTLFGQPFDFSVTGPPSAGNILWSIYRGSYLQAKTEYRLDSIRLRDALCPYLSIPERIVKSIENHPQDQSDIVSQSGDVMDNIFNVPPGTTTVNGVGNICYEGCDYKADLILNNIFGNCYSMLEIQEWMTLNPGTAATNIQSLIDDIKAELINFCMSGCSPSFPYGMLTESQLQTLYTGGSLTAMMTDLGSLESALAAQGLGNCSTMVLSTTVISAGDPDNSIVTGTAEECKYVTCFNCTTDVSTYALSFINNVIGSSSPFTQPVTTSGCGGDAPTCTYCGCVPEETTETVSSVTYHYPSKSWIQLFTDCEGFTTGDCETPNIGGVNSGNAHYPPAGERYYQYPKNITEQTGDLCYLRFYSLNGFAEEPVAISSISGINSIGTVSELSPGEFTGAINVTYESASWHALTSYTDDIYFELNMNGCRVSEQCSTITVMQLNTGEDEFDYGVWQDSCESRLLQMATQQGIAAYLEYVQNIVSGELENVSCIEDLQESFLMEYAIKEHHYTLYYYDQAGNLVQTVPPEGVEIIGASHFIASGNTVVWDGLTDNPHTYKTRYQYTSLNQPMEQETPDGGLTLYYYDDKGRITHSQNANQFNNSTYAGASTVTSYAVDAVFSVTEYDALGRIVKVAERLEEFFRTGGPVVNPAPYGYDPTDASASFTDAQISRTYYDYGNVIPSVEFEAQYTRSRVAYTTYQEYDGPKYDMGIHYSYDIHGNVKTQVNELNYLVHFANSRYKRIDYKYDLVSGKVNAVHYQPGRSDKFLHKYSYDGDNRLVRVETSNDYLSFKTDARYSYYRHGPLARVELGDRMVQGIDYAYTIHGWLKGVNAGFLNAEYDMGRDGDVVTSGYNPHEWIGRDAFGFVLDYYEGDYSPVGSGATNYTNFIAAMPTGSAIKDGLYNSSTGLYNGNIVRMHTALSAQDESVSSPTTASNSIWAVHGNVYHYDQLNRIKENIIYEAPALHTTKSYSGITASLKYGSQYSYDANGNLMSLERNGNTLDASSGYGMDDFNYDYYPGTNRLRYVDDDFTQDGLYPEDVNSGQQLSNNYTYDAIGNLIKDEAEDIDNIEWSVYGKVRKVTRESGSAKPDLEFVYDPSGQRTMKIEKTKNSNGTLKDKVDWIYTVYSRDAQGNILSVYTVKRDAGDGMELTQDEVVLYGSSRLGVWNRERSLVTGTCYPEPQYSITNTPGNEITTCNVPNQDTPMDPQLLTGAGNPDPDDVQINQNASTLDVMAYQVGTTEFTATENFNTSQVSAGSASVWVVGPEWITGRKQYELTDHLGNVLTTVSDVKKGIGSGSTADYYEANIKTTTDYYPFGMPMPGRSHTAQKCSTVTTTTTATAYSYVFSGSTESFTGLSSATVSNVSGQLKIERTGCLACSGWGAQKTGISLTGGITYTVKLDYNAGTCGSKTVRVQVKNGSGTVIATKDVTATGTGYVLVPDITPSSTASYSIEIITLNSGGCDFRIDNIQITYQQSSVSQVCTGGDGYAFGYNGQLKDNEVYGEGNSYTAEFWQYDPRIGRRWNVDPVDQISRSNYSTFGNNPIYNVDHEGDVIDPWWAKKEKGTYKEGQSPYKNFAGESNMIAFQDVALSLYNSNDIFRNTVQRLHHSKTYYKVIQKDEIILNVAGRYDNNSNTIILNYFNVDQATLFEEVFHAGQDDYYSEKGMIKNNLELEVEAKIANLISGMQDQTITNDYEAIVTYVNTGQKGEDFDKEVNVLVGRVYDLYAQNAGEEWTNNNNPNDVNKDTLFEYLRTTINNQNSSNDE